MTGVSLCRMSHVSTSLSHAQLDEYERRTAALKKQGLAPDVARRIAYARMLDVHLAPSHPVRRYYRDAYLRQTPSFEG